MGDLKYFDIPLPITEANHVIYAGAPQEVNPPILAPNVKYAFDGWVDYIDPASMGWFHANYPKIKTFYAWNTDDQSGHATQPLMKKELASLRFYRDR